MESKLYTTGILTAIAGQTLDTILEFTGNNSLPPISNHIGNWIYISAYAGLIPAFIGRGLINKGERENKQFLVKIGEYLPKITTALATLYFTLGESIFPQILSGTADSKDIPAVLLAGVATYFGVDAITKCRRNKKL